MEASLSCSANTCICYSFTSANIFIHHLGQFEENERASKMACGRPESRSFEYAWRVLSEEKLLFRQSNDVFEQVSPDLSRKKEFSTDQKLLFRQSNDVFEQVSPILSRKIMKRA